MSTSLATSPVIEESQLRKVARPWWQIWASFHWGFRKSACVLWCCAGRVTPELAYSALGIDALHSIDIVIFYREMIEALVPEAELASRIVKAMPEAERKHLKSVGQIYAGKQVFETGENRRSISDVMNEVLRKNALPRLRESDDSEETRVTDYRNFSNGLHRTVLMRSEEPPLERTKIPLILISSECPKLISTIPSLQSDEKKPEDIKRVDNEQDSIWEAARMAYREYPNVIGSLPRIVKRQMEIEKGITQQQRFLNALAYDRKQNRRITKRR